MNKAVIISIQPKWCELIASGKKTVEVRKTAPKIATPFKCYIYCTKDHAFAEKTLRGFDDNGKAIYYKANKGKVIGEFVCERIEDMRDVKQEPTCISTEEWLKYTDGHKGIVWGWHISNLVIYDKPKELIEFYTWKKCNSCRDTGYESTACCFDIDCKVPAAITRPPQSWCYVEEASNG